MRNWLPAAAAILMLTNTGAFAQANLRPDPTPRVPQQAGQGLALEDRQFISRALNLSEAEIEAGRLAAEKASATGIKEFAQRLVTEHEKLKGEVQQLAQKNGVTVDPHASRSWWQGELQRIGGLSGQDFDREYMKWQLQTHLALVNLYQTQASGTPQMELSKFAITTLEDIQKIFNQAKQLGAQQGVSIDTVRQPPQY
jgi:predicted outer membrane protein